MRGPGFTLEIRDLIPDAALTQLCQDLWQRNVEDHGGLDLPELSLRFTSQELLDLLVQSEARQAARDRTRSLTPSSPAIQPAQRQKRKVNWADGGGGRRRGGARKPRGTARGAQARFEDQDLRRRRLRDEGYPRTRGRTRWLHQARQRCPNIQHVGPHARKAMLAERPLGRRASILHNRFPANGETSCPAVIVLAMCTAAWLAQHKGILRR